MSTSPVHDQTPISSKSAIMDNEPTSTEAKTHNVVQNQSLAMLETLFNQMHVELKTFILEELSKLRIATTKLRDEVESLKTEVSYLTNDIESRTRIGTSSVEFSDDSPDDPLI